MIDNSIILETDVGECYKTVNLSILMQYAAYPTDNCQSSINITDNIPAQFDIGVHSVTYVFCIWCVQYCFKKKYACNDGQSTTPYWFTFFSSALRMYDNKHYYTSVFLVTPFF